MHRVRSVSRSPSSLSSRSNSVCSAASFSMNGPLVMRPAVVVVSVSGSLRGPIDDVITSTSIFMSALPLIHAALPYSSAQHSWANIPSLALPPADNGRMDESRTAL